MNEDEIMELDFRDTVTLGPISRRAFLKGLGGGIIILISLDIPSVFAAQAGRRERATDFNAYLRIGPDGRVSCFVGKIEMGQGVITSLAQMLADELDVSLESVDMVMGDTALCPWDMGTFGSMTTRFLGPALRAAAAEARQVLIELASERLGVPKERLQTKNGVVFDKTQEKTRVTYAELAGGKPIARHLTGKAVLKDVSEFKVMGKPALRMDSRAKVTGEAKYAADIRLPGMLYARVLKPPAHGAKPTSVDTAAAEAMEGVQVVKDGDLIAVLHKDLDAAGKALDAIKAQFDVPKAEVDDETIFDHLVKGAGEGNVVAQGGDIAEGQRLAEITVEATYLNSYVAHAPIEPHSAVVQIEGGKATVWASTQTPFPLQGQVAEAIGFPAENVRVIPPFLGGGFGGKGRGLQAIEAARLAKLVGKPVQVAWTRAEEFFYDTFRPAAVVKIKSGTARSGAIVLWDYGVYFAGERGAAQFYSIPNHRTASYSNWSGEGDAHPFATGPWRAPANNTNTFARESQIDAMAAKVGMDPVAFRLQNLTDQRMVRVLKAAAEAFGWTPAKAPSGRGFGVACGTDAGSYVASMAEVQVDKKTGHVQVKRVVLAQDMGLVINPEGARLQMEGGITMGLGYALTEEIHFKGGRINDLNFDTYELPRFPWAPQIKTVLVPADDQPPQGGGEPPIICIGALIANAIHDATGARLFQLPMTEARLRKALAARTGQPAFVA